MNLPRGLPNLAVFTNYGLEDGSGAALNMRLLLQQYPKGRVYWFNTKPSIRKTLRKESSWDFLKAEGDPGSYIESVINAFLWYLDSRILRKIWISLRKEKWKQRTAGVFLWQIWSRLEVKWAMRFCRRKGVEVCVVALDWPFMHFAWRFIKRAEGLPVLVRVDDDPRASVQVMGRSSDVATKIDRGFSECYRLAQSREVVSEGMRLYYRKRFGCDAAVRYPLSDVSEKQDETCRKRNYLPEVVHLIHMGNLRQVEKKNLETLVTALVILHEKTRRKWKIDLLGRPIERYQDVKTLEVATMHGWLPSAQFLELLQNANFSYVPHSFELNHRVFIETSFPSKIVTSVKQCIPILFHGPRESSVCRFLEEYKAGFVLDTLDPEELARLLSSIDEVQMEQMRRECLRAGNELFDERVISRRWRVGIAKLRERVKQFNSEDRSAQGKGGCKMQRVLQGDRF
jgi:glycosyltransferase involved in cell wall biosynthesis